MSMTQKKVYRETHVKGGKGSVLYFPQIALKLWGQAFQARVVGIISTP